MVEVSGRDDAFHGAFFAEVFRDLAGVDSVDGDDVVVDEVFGKCAGGAVVTGFEAAFAHDESAAEGLAGFDVFFADAVVADLGVGHGDDLACVGGVGEDFLVAHHGGVEDEFAGGFAGCADGSAFKYKPVFEGKNCFGHRSIPFMVRFGDIHGGGFLPSITKVRYGIEGWRTKGFNPGVPPIYIGMLRAVLLMDLIGEIDFRWSQIIEGNAGVRNDRRTFVSDCN